MSADQVRSAVRRLTRRLGYGSPRARLWICGIEEHGGGSGVFDDAWVLGQAQEPADEVAHAAFAGGHSTSAAWRYSFELAAFAHGKCAKEFGAAWEKRPDMLQLTNLLVLPKPTAREWRLRTLSRGEYLRIIDEDRVPFLRSARPAGSVVVCHGTQHGERLQSAFVADGEEPEITKGHRNKDILIYRRSRTVLAPFFIPHQLPRHYFEMLKAEVRALLDDSGCIT